MELNGFILGQQYNLEKQSEHGVSLELDATLASMDTLEFCLVRENSKWKTMVFLWCELISN